MRTSATIRFALALGLLARPAFLLAEHAPNKNWKNVTEISYVNANGNSKATTTSAKNTFSRTWATKTTLDLEAGALGSQSEGVTTAEQYFASEKVSQKISDRNYAFEKFGWEKNRFAGIAHRYDVSVGLGRELLAGPKNVWIAELGGGYVNEQRVSPPRNDFGSGRAYTKYTRNFTETSHFSQDAEYLHNLEENEDYRVNTETALVGALSAHFSLKASFVWKHVGRPPAGFGRNDTVTSMALIASY